MSAWAFLSPRPPKGPPEPQRRRPPAELILLAVDALSRLGNPQDARIFRFVVSRFCASPMGDETAWHIARRAAVALCKADPSALDHDLPVFFRHDPELRGAEIIASSAPKVCLF